VGNLAASNLILVLSFVQDIHHLLDFLLCRSRIFKLKLVSCDVEPVINFFLEAVTLVLYLLEHKHSFIKVIFRVINQVHELTPEVGILILEELLPLSQFLQRGFVNLLNLVYVKGCEFVLGDGRKHKLGFLNRSRFIRRQINQL